MAEGRYEEALVILKHGAKANRRTLPPDSEMREMMERFKTQVRFNGKFRSNRSAVVAQR